MRKYCEICCVSIIIYIKEKKYKRKTKKKKICNYNAAGTVATVRNLKKKKVPHQIFTIDEQWDSLNKQYINTVAT